MDISSTFTIFGRASWALVSLTAAGILVTVAAGSCGMVFYAAGLFLPLALLCIGMAFIAPRSRKYNGAFTAGCVLLPVAAAIFGHATTNLGPSGCDM